MICDTCRERQATFLLGNLETGDQVAFCGPDFARFGLDAARAALPPEEILSVLEIPTQGIVNGGAEAPAPPAKSRRKPAKAAESEPDAGQTEGPPEMAASPADE